jgi:hypothetical protein
MAATRIRLTDGEDIVVDVELPELMQAFQSALTSHQALQIQHPNNGKTVAFNPNTILYFVEDGVPINGTPVSNGD